MTFREAPDSEESIAHLLGVADMAPNLAQQTRDEVCAFLRSGSAVDASQLIHAASVRRRRSIAAAKSAKSPRGDDASR